MTIEKLNELIRFSSGPYRSNDPLPEEKVRLLAELALDFPVNEQSLLKTVKIPENGPTYKTLNKLIFIFLKICPDYGLLSLLGLDTWETGGDKVEACRRIIECIKTSSDELDLEGLELTTLPERLGRLEKIRVLNCCRNNLTTLPLSLVRLENLKELHIAENFLTDFPNELCMLRELEVLIAYENSFPTLPENLDQLPKLRELCCSFNLITTLPESLFKLQNLRILECAGNRLTALPGRIGELPQLATLDCSSNRTLTGLPESLLSLPDTCEVDLQQTGLSRDTLAVLQERLDDPNYSGPRISFSILEESD